MKQRLMPYTSWLSACLVTVQPLLYRTMTSITFQQPKKIHYQMTHALIPQLQNARQNKIFQHGINKSKPLYHPPELVLPPMHQSQVEHKLPLK